MSSSCDNLRPFRNRLSSEVNIYTKKMKRKKGDGTFTLFWIEVRMPKGKSKFCQEVQNVRIIDNFKAPATFICYVVYPALTFLEQNFYSVASLILFDSRAWI